MQHKLSINGKVTYKPQVLNSTLNRVRAGAPDSAQYIVVTPDPLFNRVDSIMLLDCGFEVVSADASDKMLKTALQVRWDRRKEPIYDRWGKIILCHCSALLIC